MHIYNENYKRLLLTRSLLPGMYEDDTGMPIIRRPKINNYNLEKIRLTNFKNLKSIKNREKTIIGMFNYDEVLEATWNDPLKYVAKFYSCLGVASPDFSVFTNMNENEIKHNIFKSRWIGSIWQSAGINVIPTITWAYENTYDVCFSGLEKNSIVIVSTIGTTDNKNVFLKGYEELKKRINPELVIVLGVLYPEMVGNFLVYSLDETFTQKVKNEQLQLFETNNYVSRKKEVILMGGRGAFKNVNIGDFTFIDGGQVYHTVGFDEGIKYLVQEEGRGGQKVPDYSHAENTIYVLLSKGKVKSIGVYENHNKVKSYDLLHTHYEPTLNKKLGWHYHTDLEHKAPAHELSQSEIEFVQKILKGARKYL